jgi:hypothetical protein
MKHTDEINAYLLHQTVSEATSRRDVTVQAMGRFLVHRDHSAGT